MKIKYLEVIIGSIILLVSIMIIIVPKFQDSESNISIVQLLEDPFQILNKQYISSDNITVVFEINDKPCTPCLVNVDEYLDLIENVYRADRIILRFFTEAQTNKDSERIIKLRNWDSIKTEFYTDSIMVENKLMFFQNEDYYTLSHISNGVLTNISEKKIILKQHYKHLKL